MKSDKLRRKWEAAIRLHQSGAIAQAIDRYREILQREPSFTDARRLLGTALVQQKDFLGAMPEIDRALRKLPDSSALLATRGRALMGLARYEDAAKSTERALALCPNEGTFWADHAREKAALGDMHAALRSIQRARHLEPSLPSHRFDEAMALLTLGDFESGWAAYETRVLVPEFSMKPQARVPFWDGRESMYGRTLLVSSEQGLGDAIQFCRYVPLIARSGVQVVLGVPAALRPWLASLDGATQVISPDDDLPHVDRQIWLLSLPFVFRTRADSIPADIPYLHPPPGRLENWRQKLNAGGSTIPGVRRIGIACSGSADHPNDRHRSIPLERFADLVEPEQKQIEWHLLQNSLRTSDEPWLSRLGIFDHRSALTDMAETAALVACMDAVVSVDTSLAHVAGAQGACLHLLLPFNAEWRWLRERRDNPWYPTATLWRQSRLDDWQEPLQKLRQTLLA